MARRLICLVAAAASVPMAWAAEPLADPTRPPAAVDAFKSGVETGGALVLQSVILGKGRKPSAIIAGQRVELNGTVGEARLVQISETEVVLVGPSGRQVLKLTPEALKRQAADENQSRRPAAPSRGTPSR